MFVVLYCVVISCDGRLRTKTGLPNPLPSSGNRPGSGGSFLGQFGLSEKFIPALLRRYTLGQYLQAQVTAWQFLNISFGVWRWTNYFDFN